MSFSNRKPIQTLESKPMVSKIGIRKGVNQKEKICESKRNIFVIKRETGTVSHNGKQGAEKFAKRPSILKSSTSNKGSNNENVLDKAKKPLLRRCLSDSTVGKDFVSVMDSNLRIQEGKDISTLGRASSDSHDLANFIYWKKKYLEIPNWQTTLLTLQRRWSMLLPVHQRFVEKNICALRSTKKLYLSTRSTKPQVFASKDDSGLCDIEPSINQKQLDVELWLERIPTPSQGMVSNSETTDNTEHKPPSSVQSGSKNRDHSFRIIETVKSRTSSYTSIASHKNNIEVPYVCKTTGNVLKIGRGGLLSKDDHQQLINSLNIKVRDGMSLVLFSNESCCTESFHGKVGKIYNFGVIRDMHKFELNGDISDEKFKLELVECTGNSHPVKPSFIAECSRIRGRVKMTPSDSRRTMKMYGKSLLKKRSSVTNNPEQMVKQIEQEEVTVTAKREVETNINSRGWWDIISVAIPSMTFSIVSVVIYCLISSKYS